MKTAIGHTTAAQVIRAASFFSVLLTCALAQGQDASPDTPSHASAPSRQDATDPQEDLMERLLTQQESAIELLKRGANVNRIMEKGIFRGITPLHLAAGMPIGISECDGLCVPPREVQPYASQKAIVGELLRCGANVNVPDTVSGMTPLMVAARSGDTDVIQLLLDAGANVHATDKSGATALSWAVESKRCDAVYQLLEAGSDVHATAADAKGYAQDRKYPLLVTALRSPVCMKLLLEYGADPSARDRFGRSIREIGKEDLYYHLTPATEALLLQAEGTPSAEHP